MAGSVICIKNISSYFPAVSFAADQPNIKWQMQKCWLTSEIFFKEVPDKPNHEGDFNIDNALVEMWTNILLILWQRMSIHSPGGWRSNIWRIFRWSMRGGIPDTEEDFLSQIEESKHLPEYFFMSIDKRFKFSWDWQIIGIEWPRYDDRWQTEWLVHQSGILRAKSESRNLEHLTFLPDRMGGTESAQ